MAPTRPTRREVLAGSTLLGLGLTTVPLPAAAESGSPGGAGGATAWTVLRAGGPSVDFGRAIDIRADGSMVVVGAFRASATFGTTTLTGSATSFTAFVASLALDGTWTWARAISGTGYSFGNGVAVLPDGSAIVCGSYSGSISLAGEELEMVSGAESDAFVARIDGTGDWKWAVAAGATGNGYPSDVIAAPGGGAVVTGGFSGAVTFGTTTLTNPREDGDSSFVARLDPGGGWTWATGAIVAPPSGTEGDPFSSVYLGSVTVAGSGFAVTGSANGSVLFGATRVEAESASVPVVAGLSSTGSWEWVVTATVEAGRWAGGSAIAALGDGSLVVAGNFSGAMDMGGVELVSGAGDSAGSLFVAGLAPPDPQEGWTWSWAISGGGSGGSYLQAIAPLGAPLAGSVVVCGGFTGEVELGGTTLERTGPGIEDGDDSILPYDLLIARIDDGGMVGWSAQAGGAVSAAGGADIAVRSGTEAVLCGNFWGTATFGTVVVTSHGQSDVLIARYDLDVA